MSGAVDEAPPPVCDSALTALFVPPRPRLGVYEVCTTSGPPAASLPRGFQTSNVEYLEVPDAFGAAGSYDRARLIQLLAGRRLEVVRGWQVANGRFESITAISPYPDAHLTALVEGTLLIRWMLPLPPRR